MDSVNGSDYDDFLGHLQSTLKRSGFPGKRVALPLEKMYEIAYEKGLNFNKALSFLEERGICHEKTAERVIFFPKQFPGDFNETLRKAEELMRNMPPAEIQRLKDIFDKMSPVEQEQLVKKAKDLGFG